MGFDTKKAAGADWAWSCLGASKEQADKLTEGINSLRVNTADALDAALSEIGRGLPIASSYPKYQD